MRCQGESESILCICHNDTHLPYIFHNCCIIMNNHEIKAVLLGESGVGKSSILLRFCSNEFDADYQSTFGAAFMAKFIEVKGIQYKFSIWDTAGQEKFRSVAPLYYRNAQVALIVYDISNRQSFETLKSWVDELKKYGPANQFIVLVGNKTDKIEDEKVTYDEASSYARSLGALFKLTSCKENKGIVEMFESIALDNKVQNVQTGADNASVLQPPSKTNKQTQNTGCC